MSKLLQQHYNELESEISWLHYVVVQLNDRVDVVHRLSINNKQLLQGALQRVTSNILQTLNKQQ